MAKSRLSMRREVEAAEELETAAPKKKAKAAKKTAVKKKKTATRARKKAADTPARRRLVWVVYSSTMREEGRYLYHERDKAEEKLNALLAKGKRRYFIQPIKEPLDADGMPMIPDEVPGIKVKGVKAAVKDMDDDDEDVVAVDADDADIPEVDDDEKEEEPA